MSIFRFQALTKMMEHRPVPVELPDVKTSAYYGVDVFNRNTMQAYLSAEAFQHVMEVIEKQKGGRLERKFANQVAIGMKACPLSSSMR
ncbi:MAG: glutamine synthetase III [Bacteroidales bacterium]